MIDKKKLIVIILRRSAIALVFAVLAVVMTSWLKGKVIKLGDSLMENKKNSVLLQKKSELLRAIEKDMAIVDGNDTKIEEAYLPVDNILDFVTTVENLATQNSSTHSISFGNPVVITTKSNGTNIYEINYTLTMTGTVYTLISYLKGFSSLPYYASVSSVNIGGSADKGWEGVSSMVIQGKVYARQQ